jgi:hypothetical protein
MSGLCFDFVYIDTILALIACSKLSDEQANAFSFQAFCAPLELLQSPLTVLRTFTLCFAYQPCNETEKLTSLKYFGLN